jgi:phosphopantothenoylcysteine decarboxylase / phosphopantothenate---cysteine ligase
VRFVITAGPTQEPIDPVRFISNRSSGRMGYALAEAALEAGHDVTLISGRVNLEPPSGARLVAVLTSDQMFDAVHEELRGCDALVMCAAVADYKPENVSTQKIKKRDQPLSLQLIPTRDILASLPRERNFLVIGFAAETTDLKKNAEKKLRDKHLDMIVANDVGRADVGMESANNEVTILFPDGETKQILRAPKKKVAHELVKIISKLKKSV